MKSSLVLGSAIALVTLVALACSGDREGNEEAVITTEKGLSVAALEQDLVRGRRTTAEPNPRRSPFPFLPSALRGETMLSLTMA